MGIPWSTRLWVLEKNHTDSQLTFPSAHFHAIPTCLASFYQPTQPLLYFWSSFPCPCHMLHCLTGWSEGKGILWNAALSTNLSPKSWEYLFLICWHKTQQSWECPGRFKAQIGDLNKLDSPALLGVCNVTIDSWIIPLPWAFVEVVQASFKHPSISNPPALADMLPICPREPLFPRPTPEKRGPLQIADHPFNYISIVMLAH